MENEGSIRITVEKPLKAEKERHDQPEYKRWIPKNALTRLQSIVTAVATVFMIGTSTVQEKKLFYLPLLIKGDDQRKTYQLPENEEGADSSLSLKDQKEPVLPANISKKQEELPEPLSKKPYQKLYQIIIQHSTIGYPLEIKNTEEDQMTPVQLFNYEQIKKESGGLIDKDRENLTFDTASYSLGEELFKTITDDDLKGDKTIWLYGGIIIIKDNKKDSFTSYLYSKDTQKSNKKFVLLFKDVSESEIIILTQVFGEFDNVQRGLFIKKVIDSGFTIEEYTKLKQHFIQKTIKSEKNPKELEQTILAIIKSIYKIRINTRMEEQEIILLIENLKNHLMSLQEDYLEVAEKELDIAETASYILEKTGKLSGSKINDLFGNLSYYIEEMPVYLKNNKHERLIFFVLMASNPKEAELFHRIYKIIPNSFRNDFRYFMDDVRMISKKYNTRDLERIVADLVNIPGISKTEVLIILNRVNDINNYRENERKELTPDEIIKFANKIKSETDRIKDSFLTKEWKKDLFVFLCNYYLSQEKANRDYKVISSAEIDLFVSFGEDLGKKLFRCLYFTPTDLANVSTKEELLKRMISEWNKQEINDIQATEAILFLNQLHDWELQNFGTDRLRMDFINELDLKTSYSIVKYGGLNYFSNPESINRIYTSTFEVFYKHLKSFPKNEYLKLLKQDTRIEFYIYLLGRFEVLGKEIAENPEIFLPALNEMINNEDIRTNKFIDHYDFLINGLISGVRSSASIEYQRMLVEMYNKHKEAQFEKKFYMPFMAFIMKNTEDIFKEGPFKEFYQEEVHNWPEIEIPKLPDLSQRQMVTAIIYFDKEQVLKESWGRPSALEYFSRKGYKEVKIDENNWVVTGFENGKMVRIMVTFSSQITALEKFNERVANRLPDISFFEQHSTSFFKFFKEQKLEDREMIWYLGSCGSTHMVNFIRALGYKAHVVSSDRVAYPEAGFVYLQQLFRSLTIGEKTWEEVDRKQNILIDKYSIRSPNDPSRHFDSFYKSFKYQ